MIDRLRTRDITAAKLLQKKKTLPLSRPVATTERASLVAPKLPSNHESMKLHALAATSRDKHTQDDTDMVTDELGNSVSSLPFERKQWLI